MLVDFPGGVEFAADSPKIVLQKARQVLPRRLARTQAKILVGEVAIGPCNAQFAADFPIWPDRRAGVEGNIARPALIAGERLAQASFDFAKGNAGRGKT